MSSPVINILRPGSFTSVEGVKVSFSAADLVQIAKSYKPETDKAPIVVGHPKTNDPAFGWIGSLAMQGDVLTAVPSEIAPSLAEAVRAGHYRKVSAQLYQPGDPNSPDPSGFYLRHVGFLGAAAPAVKGLGEVSLAGGGTAITIEITQPETAMTTISLSEHEAQLAKKDAELQAARAEAEKIRREAIHTAHVSFVEAASKAGRVAPAAKATLVGLLDQLAPLAPVSFAEGEAAVAPADALKKLIESATPLISFGEAAPADKKGPGKAPVSFAAPSGFEVDPAAAALHARAKALQAENPKLDWWAAVDRARAEA